MIEKKISAFEVGMDYLVKRAQEKDRKLAEEQENERIREQRRLLLERERVIQDKLDQKREQARLQREQARLREEADRREWEEQQARLREEEQARLREEANVARERQQSRHSPFFRDPHRGSGGAASAPTSEAQADLFELQQRIIRLEAKLEKDQVEEISFGDSFRSESKSPQNLLVADLSMRKKFPPFPSGNRGNIRSF